MMTDPSGEMSFTIGDVTINISIRGILDNIAIPKLTGFLTTAVQTVWGIPKDGTAFKKADASVEGFSVTTGNDYNLMGGIEILQSHVKHENWIYAYLGVSFSYSFIPGFYERRVNLFDDEKLGKTIYIGKVYNCKNWDDYEGSFFTISASIVKDIFGIATYMIPLNATVFSSGRPSNGEYDSYGFAYPLPGKSLGASNSSGFALSSGYTYYYPDENCSY